MPRAVEKPITLRWFALSALRRQHGWGELRIRNVLKLALPGRWRGYPQREVSEADRAVMKIDCEADTAVIRMVGTEPGGVMWWSERVEELALLLPADADGAPLPPSSDGVTISLPAPKVSESRKERPRPKKAGTAQWVYDWMKQNPPRKRERGYTNKVFAHRPDKRIKFKTIKNLVSKYRPQFERH